MRSLLPAICIVPSLIVSMAGLLLGCTFPDVDYSDTESNAFAKACFVPVACKNTVTLCSKQAANQRNTCLNQCGTGSKPACVACETEHDSALGVCLAKCEVCSAANGCQDATASCEDWLAIPEGIGDAGAD